MPRHPEGMAQWILQVQQQLQGAGGGPPQQYEDYEPQEPAPRSQGGAGPRVGRGDPVPDDVYSGYSGQEPPSKDQQAYIDAKMGGAKARARNQGGGMA